MAGEVGRSPGCHPLVLLALASVVGNAAYLEVAHAMRGAVIAAGAGVAVIVAIALQGHVIADVAAELPHVADEHVRVAVVAHQSIRAARTLQAAGDLLLRPGPARIGLTHGS
jgi:hypothetical protein